MYARISASGKNNRLSKKYPMKLCPFRLATFAGQNAIAIQIIASDSQIKALMIGPNDNM
jgi:hypothetical protein